MVHEGLKKLREGNFNYMEQQRLPDGSIIVLLTSRKWEGKERFRVRDLYGENEEVVDVNSGKSLHEGDTSDALPEVQGKARKATSRKGKSTSGQKGVGG